MAFAARPIVPRGPREVLEAMLRRMTSRTWIKGRLQDRYRYCLLGWQRHVQLLHDDVDEGARATRTAVKTLREAIWQRFGHDLPGWLEQAADSDVIAFFNDHPRTTYADVVGCLTAAIASLEGRPGGGEPSTRSPACRVSNPRRTPAAPRVRPFARRASEVVLQVSARPAPPGRPRARYGPLKAKAKPPGAFSHADRNGAREKGARQRGRPL